MISGVRHLVTAGRAVARQSSGHERDAPSPTLFFWPEQTGCFEMNGPNASRLTIAHRLVLSAVVALLAVSAFFLGGYVATQSSAVIDDGQDVFYEDGFWYVEVPNADGAVDSLKLSKESLIGLMVSLQGTSVDASEVATAEVDDGIASAPDEAYFKKVSKADGLLWEVVLEDGGMAHFKTGDSAGLVSIPTDLLVFASEHYRGLFSPDLNIFRLFVDTDAGLTRWSFAFSPSFWQLVGYITLLLLVVASLIVSRLNHQRNRLAEENRKLLVARERERERLAAEIHDGPIQDAQLIAREYLADAARLADFDGAQPTDRAVDRPASQRLETAMEQLVDRLRDICADLRPPVLYHFGLADAIRTRAGEFQERFPKTRFETYVQPVGPLPEATRIGLFRIAQEAMGNAVKHANATRISIRLFASESNIAMWIEDDGVGFSQRRRLSRSSKHQGMSLMTHLASAIGAEIEATSQPGEGTSVLVDLPIPDEVAAPEEGEAVLAA